MTEEVRASQLFYYIWKTMRVQKMKKGIKPLSPNLSCSGDLRSSLPF